MKEAGIKLSPPSNLLPDYLAKIEYSAVQQSYLLDQANAKLFVKA